VNGDKENLWLILRDPVGDASLVTPSDIEVPVVSSFDL
jgi:hypothetical protein